MLEVVFSDSEKRVLENSNLFNKEDIFNFNLLLSIGNIKNIGKKIIKIITDEVKEDINVEEQIYSFNEKIKNYTSIRIWYSSLDNEDFCDFLFAISLLKDKTSIDIHVIDCLNKDKEIYSLGAYDCSEVQILLDRNKVLTRNDIDLYASVWDKLVFENKDIRIVNNSNKIESYTYEYLDNKILEILSKYEEKRYYGLVAECLVNRVCNFMNDIIFETRIDSLIKRNKIIVTKVVNEKNGLGELKEHKYIKINN